jgi:hypothetical protein
MSAEACETFRRIRNSQAAAIRYRRNEMTQHFTFCV